MKTLKCIVLSMMLFSPIVVLSRDYSNSGEAMKDIRPSHFPVYEWEDPKFAIMGGLSDCGEVKDYYYQYLKYMESLSRFIPVKYFTNDNCKSYIKSHIDTKNIEFVNYSLNSIWIRDYAPVWLKDSLTEEFSMVNFPYGANHFGKQKDDDQFSSFLSNYLEKPLLLDFPRGQVPLYFDGGNIVVDEDGGCYTSIKAEDPPEEYRRKLLSNINCDDLTILKHIPEDPTGHVDMYLKMLPGKKALLASYTRSPFREAMLENKFILEKKGFKVIDLPHVNEEGSTNRSYANALLVGKTAFVPEYGFEKEDITAEKIYKELGFKVVMVPADKIIQENGSLHCITNFIY